MPDDGIAAQEQAADEMDRAARPKEGTELMTRSWQKIHDTPRGLRYFTDGAPDWRCRLCGWTSAEGTPDRGTTCPRCWEREERLARLYLASRVAIADRSGWAPDKTDHGILWLDPTRLLVVRLAGSAGYSIPVVRDADPAGKRYMTDEPSALEDVLRLWRAIGGRVHVVGLGRQGLALLAELARWEAEEG